MSRAVSLAILLACALLEAAGDALVRRGIHAASAGIRGACYLAGAAALFGYGWLVNRPPWSFGSLLAVYIVLFFVIAQAAAWAAFGEKPALHMIVGGALIVAGGIVIAAKA